jgi:modification methylase
MIDGFPVNQILQGDCVELLANFPEKSIDLIFADPPYNLQLQNELWRPNLSRVDAVMDDWDQFTDFAAYDAFTLTWLQACKRVLKDTGTLWVIGTYHNIFRVGAILQDLGFWILNDIVWIKDNPMPNFRGVRFTNAHETLIWAQKKQGSRYTFHHQAMKSMNDDLQMRSDWYLPLCNGRERLRVNGKKVHATQKPEALLYRVILSSSDPGDIILDPFFGTGTTGAVAKKLRRSWVGIEKDPYYVEIAQKRLEDVEEPPYSDIIFNTPPRSRQHRLPFGTLLEYGLIQPGQVLSFSRDHGNPPPGDLLATVLADGQLQWGEIKGSIHQLARNILGAPANGWQHWYYRDTQSDQWLSINHLRQEIRSITADSSVMYNPPDSSLRSRRRCSPEKSS